MFKSENLAGQIFIQNLELLSILQGHPVPGKATIKRSSVLNCDECQSHASLSFCDF